MNMFIYGVFYERDAGCMHAVFWRVDDVHESPCSLRASLVGPLLQVTVALNNYKAFSTFPTTMKRRIAATGSYERYYDSITWSFLLNRCLFIHGYFIFTFSRCFSFMSFRTDAMSCILSVSQSQKIFIDYVSN